ncbi:MAG: MFS transporter [Pseudohongiellaceae bacterium]
MTTPSTSTPHSEINRDSVGTTAGAMLGLSLGPSVLAVLTVSSYVQPIEQEFGWTRPQVSLAFSLVAYMIVLVSPLQGWFVDRFGPRRTILTSIPLFGLGLMALYFTPASLAVYYLLWALLPVLALGLWPLSYLQAVSGWFDRRLGLALGCANGGIGLGSTLVPLLTALLIPTFGWRGALLALGVLVIAVSWPLVWWLLRESTQIRLPGAAEGSGLAFAELKGERSFLLLNVGFFLLGLTASSLVNQQVPLLTEAGWSPEDARSLVASVFGLALLCARVTVGFVLDHVFAPRGMQAVALGGALSCVLYAVQPDLAIVSAILLGFLLGAEFDVLAFLIKRYYGTLAYGKAYGVIFSMFYLGTGLGISAMAWLRESVGNYDVGLIAAAGVLVAAALILQGLPRYRFEPIG